MINKIKSFIQDLGNFGPLLAFSVVGPGLGAIALTTSADHWLEALRSQPYSLLIFFLCGVSLTGVSLIPTHAVSLVAGILFGAIVGPAYAILTITSASIVSYSLFSRFLDDQLLSLLEKKPKAYLIYNELLKSTGLKTLSMVILIRLSPVMPFAGTNVLLAAGKVRKREYILGSAIGLAPRVILVTIAGSNLSSLDLGQGADRSVFILGITATLVSLAIIGKVSRQALKKMVEPAALTE
ncbi:VTT domain-containing protein [Lentisphaera profundi]|uniref:TVP38/TMEM64 family membrane protein n=1 Tax=Lentisphaera profundi TaxID=1658616 RepID=A0ABY7VP18_9BACT|nr:VTT domain-containing protein [Lentisphaera profundi]WDE95422.1 VTT domain-containing protein [Lentisphaera profundi]